MDEKTRIVEVLRLLFRSSEEEVITQLSNNLDLLDIQFGYEYLSESPCVCMKMLEQVKHNGHIFHPEKVIEFILHGKCSHVTNKSNPRFIRQARTSFLIVSCILQKFDIIKFLTDNGVSLDQKTSSMSLTPLNAAILSKNMNIFNFILSSGVDVNTTCTPCTNKVSSLMLAVLEGAEDMVEILLDHPNVNKSYINTQSKTALCCAAEINSVRLVDKLIKAGLKATNMTICKAVQTNNAELLQLVISSRRYFVPQFQTYALHTAVKLSNKSMLKLLLDRGFHFNHGTDKLYDQESLHLAVLRNDEDMVRILLNHQIKLDNELNGYTALDWAELMDYEGIIEMIKNEYRLRCIKPQQKKDRNCIIDALFERDGINRSGVIRKLASKGFDINSHSKEGLTMLHEAVFDHDSDSLKVLLELGANPDINSTSIPIRTPLYDAVSNGNIMASRLLLDANASMDFIVKYEENIIVNDLNDNDNGYIVPPEELPLERSVLCAAVCRNLADMVWLLLSSGYNIQQEKKTSLQWMIEKSKSDDIRLWLSCNVESPQNLLICCRDYIRKLYKYDLKLFVENQCIPQHLKDKLLLKDILYRDVRSSQRFCHWRNIY
ncbi:ankyrin-1-like [Mytilus californianus]|uniref:ankyrin-1-like n=1 Tax=Mytilus californianus TaxID=6549 RepID=UPI002246A936|nr:ankyrin-1-like [Mytilus californianus]XP_052099766.1 ankyrin-1-like [Mytilus californianus]